MQDGSRMQELKEQKEMPENSKCIRQTLIKLNRETDKSTSRAGDFTTINKQAKIQEGP